MTRGTDDDGAATRAWRSADEAPLKVQTRQMRWLVLATIGMALLVSTLLVVLLTRGRDRPPLTANGGGQRVTSVAPVPAAQEVAIDAAPPKPELPPWVEIRVARVRVAPPTTPWDGPQAEEGLKDTCKGISVLAGLLSAGVGTGIGLACVFVDDPQRQTDPSLPDLQLLLEIPGVRYPSYIAFDQVEHSFDYSFDIPAQAVSENGMVLSVVDADIGSERGQQIGSVRLSKEELIAASISGRIMNLMPSGLEMLEVEVHPYDGMFKKQILKLDTAKGGSYVRGFPVSAGDIIRVEARGEWTIGSWYSDLIGPQGYPSGGPIESNLELFPREPHGAAVAVVGAGGQVNIGPVSPCFKIVAKYAGAVWVGVNDRKFHDNNGVAEFTIMKRGPNGEQWATPGAIIPCE